MWVSTSFHGGGDALGSASGGKSEGAARARQTAAIIGKIIRRKPREDTRLREISFGRWEGKTAEEILKGGDKAFRRWSRGEWADPPGGNPPCGKLVAQ